MLPNFTTRLELALLAGSPKINKDIDGKLLTIVISSII
jgi:hypothetical protein